MSVELPVRVVLLQMGPGRSSCRVRGVCDALHPEDDADGSVALKHLID